MREPSWDAVDVRGHCTRLMIYSRRWLARWIARGSYWVSNGGGGETHGVSGAPLSAMAGVILFELLTLRRPFECTNIAALILAVTQNRVDDAPLRASQYPPALWQVPNMEFTGGCCMWQGSWDFLHGRFCWTPLVQRSWIPNMAGAGGRHTLWVPYLACARSSFLMAHTTHMVSAPRLCVSVHTHQQLAACPSGPDAWISGPVVHREQR